MVMYKNKTGRLNIDADVKGNANVKIDQESNVRVNVKNGQTDAKVTLDGKNNDRKIDVSAKGKDFSVAVVNDDIDVNLNKSTFKGSITPNPKIGVQVETQTASDLKVKIKRCKRY
jgi:hypothetical protein